MSSIKGSYLLPPLLHNLGNTLYRIGETEKGTGSKITAWQWAIDAYTKALSLKKDPETVANYEFVRKKYEQIKKEEDQKEQEKKQEEEKKKQDEQKKEELKKDEKTWSGAKVEEKKDASWKEWAPKEQPKEWSGQQPSTKPWTNQGSYNSVGWQSKDNEQAPLSEAERKEIENYLQSLRDFQKQNGKFLTPDGLENKWGSVSDQIDSFFRNDPFFRDIIPSSDPTKKDW
ncbi:MAG: hypothetical protein ACD_78C00233G0003 [uncultured bacterium (gcode 4)]|uniref:Uncharacterized protein n=1 Tax=uncultured bacterium (gcode 4) TaxID=1234023 RepID=K1XXB6_9BACT|nr:MAG: hypothetical protein ACD_78C00233G0003 [uncultured bacterium (gcode 4)]